MGWLDNLTTMNYILFHEDATPICVVSVLEM
jgi:hypothetical protein